MKFFSTKNLVLFIYATAFLLARMSFASECKGLNDELDSMRKAQHQIMLSLLQNHYVFAENMDSLLSEMSFHNGDRPSSAALSGIKKTSQAYRVRAEKGQVLAEKLNKASVDLMNKVKKCLK